MHYGVSPGGRAEERKWWDYTGLGPREHGTVPPPHCSKKCPDLQGRQEYGYTPPPPTPHHHQPIKPRQAPDLKIIRNLLGRMEVRGPGDERKAADGYQTHTHTHVCLRQQSRNIPGLARLLELLRGRPTSPAGIKSRLRLMARKIASKRLRKVVRGPSLFMLSSLINPIIVMEFDQIKVRLWCHHGATLK